MRGPWRAPRRSARGPSPACRRAVRRWRRPWRSRPRRARRRRRQWQAIVVAWLFLSVAVRRLLPAAAHRGPPVCDCPENSGKEQHMSETDPSQPIPDQTDQPSEPEDDLARREEEAAAAEASGIGGPAPDYEGPEE